MPLKGMGFDVRVTESLVALKMTQSYLNPDSATIDAMVGEDAK